jgi:hypothetical protein
LRMMQIFWEWCRHFENDADFLRMMPTF